MQKPCSAARLLPIAGPLHRLHHAHSRPRPTSLTPPTGPVWRINRFETTASSNSSQPSSSTQPSSSSQQWSPPDPLPIRRVQGARWKNRIVPGNLEATLDVHRSANRAAVVRKVSGRQQDDEARQPKKATFTPLPQDQRSQPLKTDQSPRISQDHAPQSFKEEEATPATTRSEGTTTTLDDLIARISTKSVIADDDFEKIASQLSRHRGHVVSRPKRPHYSYNVEMIPPWNDSHPRLFPWKDSSHRPWAEHAELSVTSRRKRVEDELVAFTQWISPTPQEHHQASNTTDYITRKIRAFMSTVSIDAHGSRVTGLADSCSDVDLCVTHNIFDPTKEPGPKLALTHPKAKVFGLRALSRIRGYFSKDPRLQILELVYARVPVIELLDNQSRLTVQISANTSFKAIRDATRHYRRQFPHALPIFMVIRQALRMRGLASVRTGGLGSYSLFMMVITALNHKPIPAASHADSFRHVLEFWARADLRSQGFAVDPVIQFDKWDHGQINKLLDRTPDDPFLQGCLHLVRKNQTRLLGHKRGARKVALDEQFPNHPRWHEGLLMLQDPADPVNDLGIKSFRIDDVMNTWRHMTGKYVARLNMWQALPEDQRATHGGCLLDPFLYGDYSVLKRRREGLESMPAPILDPAFLTGIQNPSCLDLEEHYIDEVDRNVSSPVLYAEETDQIPDMTLESLNLVDVWPPEEKHIGAGG